MLKTTRVSPSLALRHMEWAGIGQSSCQSWKRICFEEMHLLIVVNTHIYYIVVLVSLQGPATYSTTDEPPSAPTGKNTGQSTSCSGFGI